jgi:hypothetical protein
MRPKLLLLTGCFLCAGLAVSAQESTIVKLLNDQLKKEKPMREPGEEIAIVQPFRIDEQHVLSVEFSDNDPYWNRQRLTRLEVPLNQISSIVKDINVLFESENKAVKQTVVVTDSTGKAQAPQVDYTGLFFTQICKERDNAEFRDKMVKAFRKAGYTIGCVHWYD